MKNTLYELFARSVKNALVLTTVAVLSTPVWAEKINLNTADVETMQYIPGIGQSRAEQIIQAREKAGSFATMDELDAIPGIGEATMQDILKYGSLDSGVSELTDEMRQNRPLRDTSQKPAAATDASRS